MQVTNNKNNYRCDNIEKLTIENTDYRRVLFTTNETQLVLMSISKEDIGIKKETHTNTTQFIRVEKGKGIATLNGTEYKLYDGISLVIGAGVEHKIKQIGEESLKLYTLYSPPEHEEDLVQKENK